jgi:ribulose-5-phosphate 4-epimerase/fuculose-1-phosphate aldolase
MTVSEGTIQFAFDLKATDSPVLDEERFGALAAWRELLLRLRLVGCDPQRYGGLGFGNLSVRDPQRPGEFVITASQTGAVTELTQEHLTRILSCNLERFWVDALGQQPPSSETMTHAAVYASDARIGWVFHAQRPEIWQRAGQLALPTIGEAVAYGSPAMVTATGSLLAEFQSRPLVFATLGHEDGVFACGPTSRDTGGLLVSYLARALGS